MVRDAYSQIAETFYCTEGYPIPATVRFELELEKCTKPVRILTDTGPMPAEVVLAILDSNAEALIVLDHLIMMMCHIARHYRTKVPSRLFYVKGRRVVEAGGNLFLDENSQERYNTTSLAPWRTSPWEVLVALSGPLDVKSVQGHLFEVVQEIRKNGLPELTVAKIQRLVAGGGHRGHRK